MQKKKGAEAGPATKKNKKDKSVSSLETLYNTQALKQKIKMAAKF